MGAKIIGTIQRQGWFPFTYEQKQSGRDKRQDIPTQGPVVFHRKEQKVGGLRTPKVSVLAYRDAKGHVTLGISTFNRMNAWEIVLEHEKDGL